MKERIIIDGLLEGNFDNCLDDRMAKCKVCGGETFFIRHLEGGDHFRIVCTECETLCGHLYISNIPMVGLTDNEIDADCAYFGLGASDDEE